MEGEDDCTEAPEYEVPVTTRFLSLESFLC